MDRAREIVNGYDGGVTLRQVMYRLVSEGLPANTAPTYRRLSSRLAAARRQRRFPDVIDTLREVQTVLTMLNGRVRRAPDPVAAED